MASPNIVFLHKLRQDLADKVLSACPPGLATTAIHDQAPEQEKRRALADADFLIMYRARLDDGLMRAAGRLKLVQLLAAGYDNLNVGLLARLGIACANNGGANSWAVADQAVMMMLCIYRRGIQADSEVRQGKWNAGVDGANTFELAGKTVGILGLGNIGQKVARRVQAFDAQVLYHNRTRLPAARERELGVAYAPLDELIAASDILSLHAPLTDDTRHLIGRDRLAAMKRGAVLINTSRGALVDEAALADALREGRIAAAGLDAFESEPVDPANPLLALPNVMLSPHSGGTTADTWVRRGRFAYDNIARVLRGEPPLSPVREGAG